MSYFTGCLRKRRNDFRRNSRFGAAGGLAHERQLLLEEQKLCKARARKLSLETTRRRKALEEKRRQLDVQDERLKESVLQQRRQQIQDATERFQQAHLPPSQRRRRTFRRNVPTLEAALGQIQNTQHSPSMSNTSHVDGSCTPSLKPPSVSKPPHDAVAVSAVEAYAKLLQEQLVAHFKNRDKAGEKEPELEQEQHHSPQDSYLSDSCDSESPFSRDSLEIEEPDHGQNLHGSYSSFWPDSEKPNKNPSLNQKDLFPAPSENLKREKQEESVTLNNETHFSKTETHSGLNNRNLLRLCEMIHPEHFEDNSTGVNSSRPKQDNLLDLTRTTVHDDRRSAAHRETPQRPNVLFNDSRIYNVSQKAGLRQTGKENQRLSSRSEPRTFINNLHHFIDSELKQEKAMNAPMLRPGDTPKCREVKGILKKTPGHAPGDAPRASPLGHLIFAKQVALAIRDSVELTKVKAQDVESNNNNNRRVVVKKKLRWFDGVRVDDADAFPHPRENLEDHQRRLGPVPWASEPGPGVTPTASCGYQFTKRAWADVGVQVTLPPERGSEVKVHRGAGVPQRESGPVSTRARKGTVVRPQSAAEVNRIAKTQGRVMVPRPPPRTEKARGTDRAPAPAVKHALLRDTPEGFARNLTLTSVHTTPMPPEGAAKAKADSARAETRGCGGRGTAFNEKRLCLDSTPTDEEIAELWHSIRGVFATKEVTAPVRGPAAERKVGVEQNTPCPGSANTKLSQPIKQTAEPVGKFSRTFNGAFAGDGERRAAAVSAAAASAAAAADPRKDRTVETAQTRCPGTGQHGELTSLSLEEQRILLSLDRLNHRLYCMQGHVPSPVGRQGLVLVDAPATNRDKQRLLSANNSSLHYKKL